MRGCGEGCKAMAAARACVAGQAYTVFHLLGHAQDTVPFCAASPHS